MREVAAWWGGLVNSCSHWGNAGKIRNGEKGFIGSSGGPAEGLQCVLSVCPSSCGFSQPRPHTKFTDVRVGHTATHLYPWTQTHGSIRGIKSNYCHIVYIQYSIQIFSVQLDSFDSLQSSNHHPKQAVEAFSLFQKVPLCPIPQTATSWLLSP